jgi:AraC-like DNA-binding protein
VRMPMSVLRRVADERTDVAGATLRFESLSPISPAAARGWRHLTRFLDREVTADDGMLDNPLLEHELTQLAAATALSTFPNSTLRDTSSRGPHATAPAAVRRAMAYIDANAGEPITITDIAREAGVTPRSVQYGFARHLDMTPMAHLQRVRLTYAHRDLKAADPT